MGKYECSVCGHIADEEKEQATWDALPADWACPVCESDKTFFSPIGSEVEERGPAPAATGTGEWARASDDFEITMASIHEMAKTGASISEPMRTRKPVASWDDILIRGAQLAKVPLNEDVDINTTTVIGPKAKRPLVIETPITVSHMSFGALSREAKLALAKGSAAAQTAMCSGEGGILPESLESAYKYIFEYVPNAYSVTDENLKRVDAIEIKIGQSAKPGMGGHLPGAKVTEEVASVRGFPEGADIVSPAHFDDITNGDELKAKVDWLRKASGGKPVGVKLAAGHIEADLEVAVSAGVDFVTVDGRGGATGSALKFVKDSASMPTIYALERARAFLDGRGADGVSLIITGGLRISSDFAKALAMGADAVAIATAALMAIGCQQYRVCNTGKCPVGVTSQDPELRARLDVDRAAEGLANFLRVSTDELKAFARLTGNDDVHKLNPSDLCTTNSEISAHTRIAHA